MLSGSRFIRGSIETVPAGGGQGTTISEEAPGGVNGGPWSRLDWAPNGGLLVAGQSFGIHTVNPVTGAASGNLALSGREPVFSPDGTRIAYALFGDTYNIWTMDVNGGTDQQVTFGGYDRAPNWGRVP